MYNWNRKSSDDDDGKLGGSSSRGSRMIGRGRGFATRGRRIDGDREFREEAGRARYRDDERGNHSEGVRGGRGRYGDNERGGRGRYGDNERGGRGRCGEGDRGGRGRYGESDRGGRGSYGEGDQSGRGRYDDSERGGRGRFGGPVRAAPGRQFEGRRGRGRHGDEERGGGRGWTGRLWDKESPSQKNKETKQRYTESSRLEVSVELDLVEGIDRLSVASSYEETTTYSTTEEEVLSVDSESVFKSSNSQLDLLSQCEVDPFAPIEYAKEIHKRLEPANRAGMEIVKLTTNMFPIRTDPNRVVYRYDVCVDLVLANNSRGSGMVAMNRGPKDDSQVTRRSEAVRAALKSALEAYRILSNSGVTVFDGTAILFSNEDLAMALKPFDGSLTFPITHLPREVQTFITSGDAREITISIRPCTDTAHRFTIGETELKIMNGESDRPLRQFYELLTNEGAMKKGSYVFYGAGKAFLKLNNKNCCYDIGFGQERRQGLTKGIRFIEGERDDEAKKADHRLVAALVLDAKVGTFYKANGLLDTILQLNRWNGIHNVQWDPAAIKKTSHYLKGLRLEVSNSKNSFVCFGLDLREDAGGVRYRTLMDCEEAMPGSKRLMPSIEKYERQGIQIRYPHWPVVIQRSTKGRGKDSYFPIELLNVAPHQRVPLNKFNVNPEKARKPEERWKLIRTHLDELDLSASAPILAGFGVYIDTNPLRVTGFRRPAPKVRYGDSLPVATDAKKAGWKQGTTTAYSEGALVDKLFVGWSGPPRLYSMIKAFVDRFVEDASKKGIKVCSVDVEAASINLEDEVRSGNLFAKARNEKKRLGSKAVVIVVYISNKFVDAACRIQETKSHGLLKFLEAKHQIVTQHIGTETILGRKQYDGSTKPMDSATMENILNKFNLKAFGLNYTVVPEEFAKEHWFGSTLILGYDVCHPTGQTVGERALGYAQESPSVVGFSHNGSETRDAFVGDFAFQEPNRERVDERLLNGRIKWMLKWWQKRRDTKLPENIFIFRDGVSEGQYEMVLTQEFAAIQEACDEFEVGYRPNFVLVVVTKRHNKRFFKDDGNENMANPEALTVVDQEIVRTDLTEMFIQSHHAIQGTAKPTQYVLLFSSDSSINQDNLQSFTLALTFQHQICNMPVSIPEPVYQADEWAKRGSELLKTYKDLKFNLPRKNGADGRDRRQPIDWDEMTRRLGYMDKPLDGIRANA